MFAVELLLAAPFFVPEIAGRADGAPSPRASHYIPHMTAFRLVELLPARQRGRPLAGRRLVKHDETDDFP